MDIRGLFLVNSTDVEEHAHAFLGSGPLGILDVAGKSALQRMAERLQRFGVTSISAVVEAPDASLQCKIPEIDCIAAPPDRFWRAAETAFNDMAQTGAELVLVVRLGAYAEVDFERLIQFHVDRPSRVTRVVAGRQPLDIFCLSASRRNDAASLFRSHLNRCRSEGPQMRHEGYVNQLASPCDLRQFAVDILTRVTETCPAGKETKPGVWLAPGATIEKGARLLAPSFIGSFARIRTGAVITRCASVESHAVIDCGTVVENSTVLPYSYIGAGLDLAHSLAGKGHIANLRRDVTAEIADPRLMAAIAETSGKKMLDAATEFLAFLPRMMLQSIVFAGKKPVQPDLNATLHKGSPSLGDAHGYEASACDPEVASKFPNMVVARRYGHQ